MVLRKRVTENEILEAINTKQARNVPQLAHLFGCASQGIYAKVLRMTRRGTIPVGTIDYRMNLNAGKAKRVVEEPMVPAGLTVELVGEWVLSMVDKVKELVALKEENETLHKAVATLNERIDIQSKTIESLQGANMAFSKKLEGLTNINNQLAAKSALVIHGD